MRPDDVTSLMVREFMQAYSAADDGSSKVILEDAAEKAGLAAVLSMPEVRQAIHDDVRRESDEKLKAMGVTGYSLEWDR